MIENSEGVVRVSLIRWERNLKAEGRYNLQDDTNLVCERGGERNDKGSTTSITILQLRVIYLSKKKKDTGGMGWVRRGIVAEPAEDSGRREEERARRQPEEGTGAVRR